MRLLVQSSKQSPKEEKISLARTPEKTLQAKTEHFLGQKFVPNCNATFTNHASRTLQLRSYQNPSQNKFIFNLLKYVALPDDASV